MTDKTMGFYREGRLLVIVHGTCSPSNLEWASFVKAMQGYPRQPLRILSYSHGGGPDRKQRKLATDVDMDPERSQYIMVALLSSSTIMRAMGAALSWYVRHMRVFGLDADADAFKFLGLTAEESAQATAARKRLERELT